MTVTGTGGPQVVQGAPVKLAGMDPRIADRIEPFCRLVTDPQIAWYGRPLRDPLRDLVARPDDQAVTDVAAFLQNRGAEVRREPGNSGRG